VNSNYGVTYIVITGFRYSVRIVCTLTISAVAIVGVKIITFL